MPVHALWRHKYFLKGALKLFREISHPTRATFETNSSSTVAEPSIDLWTPNVLVFMKPRISYSSSTVVSVAILSSFKLHEFIGKVSVAL